MQAKISRHQTLLILIFTTLAFSGIYAYIFDKKLDLNGDNANYYMLGKALAAGEGYININTLQKRPNNHFPPGYPAIISGTITILGDSIINIKLVNGLFFLVTLFGLYFLIIKLTSSNLIAIISILLILVNVHFLRYSTMIMSEIPFMFFSIMAILSFLKIQFEKPFWKDPWLYITIILLGLSFYIRSSGIAIIGSIVLYLFITKRWQHGFVIIVAIIVIALPWQIRSFNLGGSSYLKQLTQVNPYRPELGMANFSDFADRFGSNFGRYLSKEIPAATFSFYTPNYREDSTSLEWLLGISLFVLIVYGIWNLKKYNILILTYLAGTLALLFLWPDVWFGVRFILPATPFLVIGLVNGLQKLLEKLTVLNTNKKLQWLLILLIIPFLYKLKPLHDRAVVRFQPNWENYFLLAQWVNKNIDHGAIIACRKPTIFYLYSNTYTVNYKYSENPEELINDLITKKVDYVVMEQLGFSSTYRYLIPAVRNNMDRFEVIKRIGNPDTFLLRMKKQNATP